LARALAIEGHLEDHLVARVGIEPEIAASGMRSLLQLGRIDAIHHLAVGVHAARRIAVAAQSRVAAHDDCAS
jgi:hypothetical protein